MIAFIQALGVIGYCSLIAMIFWQLTILSTSAMICGLLVFAYPVKLYLKTKKYEQSLKIVFMTSVWLVVFSLLIMTGILMLK
ncbi:hypothetical protein COW80_04025 [Candidatus Beckwithbacteria bacterium CG22_combo_CG10-13_8_21_14_all_01_47_9]|uniref:Uncharacterized protein n=4 Tax=Candidatus Beckwithiibacteriota TaxID=1752726 RepID=A0A2H0E0H1_9BACT|nr:MAG: hypothetical protein COX09_04980 [Candidatus Beckwithbacteria bacterium CG23_combo_of_CG06-09_8_20_14_all_47_9]PIP87741.1 MAG: hypothetical protein COW80_04025 [Candidatus Beckwithbacteria bacterium CG22_combo_CG10-13_8_21_14_all_01_47_9]PJC66546.1 MAG: hypothetical protein CO018_01335 [Candidatus Beckwithbacteria bacterium CG_4_9_14_0_2_um_filter_47_11]